MKLYNVNCVDFPTQKKEIIGQVSLWELEDIEENFGTSTVTNWQKTMLDKQNLRIIEGFMIGKYNNMWLSGVDCGLYEFSVYDKSRKAIKLMKIVHFQEIAEGEK